MPTRSTKKFRTKKSKATKTKKTRVVPMTVLVKQMSKTGLKGPALMIAAGKVYRKQKRQSRQKSGRK